MLLVSLPARFSAFRWRSPCARCTKGADRSRHMERKNSPRGSAAVLADDGHVPQPGSGPSQAAARRSAPDIPSRSPCGTTAARGHSPPGAGECARGAARPRRRLHRAEGWPPRGRKTVSVLALFRRAGALILFVICHLESPCFSRGMRGPAAARHARPPARPEEGKNFHICTETLRAGPENRRPAQTARHSRARPHAANASACLYAIILL